MGRYYGTKIKNETIYPKTGLPWTLDDVPVRWYLDTQKWLEENP